MFHGLGDTHCQIKTTLNKALFRFVYNRVEINNAASSWQLLTVVTMKDEYWMKKALALACKAEAAGEVPVGAVLVKGDELIAEGWNQPISSHDATSHAEIMAMREAGIKLNNYRLIDTTMYVTLEPCSMCVGAMIHARVAKVVYGASEPRTGALGGAFNLLEANQHNHVFEIVPGVLAEDSKMMLQDFFQSRRK